MAYLIPRDPFGVTTFRRQMDDLFDHFFPYSNTIRGLVNPEGTAALSVDVVDNEKEFVVKANVPGLTAKDLDVRVTREGVVIKGAHQEESEEEKGNYIVRERRAGSFARAIPLQHPVNPDAAQAKFKDGVLELTLPKLEAEKHGGRQLQIEEK